MKFTSVLMFGVLLNGLTRAAVPSVGLFPPSFPRDPVDVNVYLEHILMGQIIEPLVESSADGSIVPAAADRWQFSPDGLVLRFYFDGKSHFSNGKPVTAEDAKYTLEKHIQSANSQSKSYLQRINRFEIVGTKELVLHLKTPYVAMLKALSRDQLGIVPKGWTFDANAAEPYIGSAAYRAIREKDGWFLRKNPYYRDAEHVQIPEWKVVLQTKDGSPAVPDLVPFAYSETTEELHRLPGWAAKPLISDPVTHFFQSSAWWYPHGKTYADPLRQKLGMCAVEELMSSRAAALGLTRATGLIPSGIAGHLSEAPKSKCALEILESVKNREFSIAVISRELATLQNTEAIRAVEKKFKVKLAFSCVEGPEIPLLKQKRPDVFVLAFAGGFQDPEGFLTVITALLLSDLKTIFQSEYPTYEAASSQTNWDERSPLYQLINRHLVEKQRVVPGWRLKAERLHSENLLHRGEDLRYTPKLKDFELRKEAL